MQVNRTQMAHSPNFTSVIPLRVYIDGMETFSEKNIKAASRQLTTLLVGPTKNNEQAMRISKKLAQRDPDYDFSRAYEGMRHSKNRKKTTPSDFFRLVLDRETNCFYLFTGFQGERMSQLGKAVGNERYTANSKDCPDSFDLIVAKHNYENYIKTCINNIKLRITEYYSPATNKRVGKPLELNILMESNKKYGKSTFNAKLSDIVLA